MIDRSNIQQFIFSAINKESELENFIDKDDSKIYIFFKKNILINNTFSDMVTGDFLHQNIEISIYENVKTVINGVEDKGDFIKIETHYHYEGKGFTQTNYIYEKNNKFLLYENMPKKFIKQYDQLTSDVFYYIFDSLIDKYKKLGLIKK